jgi:3-deoxy-D-manno-octulosonic-acid transferase
MIKVLYYIVLWIVLILFTPYLIYLSRKNKYKEAVPKKFFLINNPKFQENKIWFHTCSMGETRAIKPIVDKLNSEVNISVITNTGYEEACKMSDESSVRYLPFETYLPFWATKQKALVVMEAELWYMLFLSAKNKGAKTYLINARINDKSYPKYKKYKVFYKHIDMIFAQTEVDKKRLKLLGAKNIKVIGNIKLATLPKKTKNIQKPDGIVITAGSTHIGEEEIVLNSWDISQGRLIVVPRHPERFDEVYDLIESRYQNSDISYHRYSQNSSLDSDIVLIDAMGELNNIYAISDVVILGGGFIDAAGGHNPIEPAFFGNILISGKTIFNQKSLFECVNNYYLVESNELKSYLDDISTLKAASLTKAGTIAPIIKELNSL